MSVTDNTPGATDLGECPSETSSSLTLLQGAPAFTKHLQNILQLAHRQVCIFSYGLDNNLFACQATCRLLSQLARRHRQTEVLILIKSTSALIGRYHGLVELQQRLPSKIHLRQLSVEQDVDPRSYVIVDGRQLLLQHDDREFDGFCDTDAAPLAKTLLEEFRGLWERHSKDIVELRRLSL